MLLTVRTCARCKIKTDDYFLLFEPIEHHLCVVCFNILEMPYYHVSNTNVLKFGCYLAAFRSSKNA